MSLLEWLAETDPATYGHFQVILEAIEEAVPVDGTAVDFGELELLDDPASRNFGLTELGTGERTRVLFLIQGADGTLDVAAEVRVGTGAASLFPLARRLWPCRSGSRPRQRRRWRR